jgi:hypothetical protein
LRGGVGRADGARVLLKEYSREPPTRRAYSSRPI